MNTTKAGTGMIAAGFVLGLGVLTMFFNDVEDRQRNPNQAPVTNITDVGKEVRLLRNRQGHYVMTGLINGAPAELLLDTGATDVVVPMDLADELGLAPGRPMRAMTANGAVTVYGTVIGELVIGDITLFNVNASLNPAMQPPGILLGMSALQHVEFVQQGDSLTLRQTH